MITLVLISFWLICKCQCMCNKNCKDRCNGMTDQSHHSMASLSFTLTSRLTAESTNDHQDVWMGLQPVATGAYMGMWGGVWFRFVRDTHLDPKDSPLPASQELSGGR